MHFALKEYRRHHSLQTLLLLSKFVTIEKEESFVSRTNALLVSTFMSTRDVSVRIASILVHPYLPSSMPEDLSVKTAFDGLGQQPSHVKDEEN